MLRKLKSNFEKFRTKITFVSRTKQAGITTKVGGRNVEPGQKKGGLLFVYLYMIHTSKPGRDRFRPVHKIKADHFQSKQ